MAEYYIGIDGGGSKTQFLCVDRMGNYIGSGMTAGTYCAQDGIAVILQRLENGIKQCLPCGSADVAIGFGMPALGENKTADLDATKAIREALSPMKIVFENDAVLGWAAAFALEPGVVVIGGTGSIGYGVDSSGNSCRCGGWHEFMSDEGSGYWLGKKLLRLFSKESDGRLPVTPLYELTRQKLSLSDDYDINALAHGYSLSRNKTAELQKILLEAARKGDVFALECYDKAAQELAEIAIGVIKQLDFPEEKPVNVSYSGGLFKVEDLIVKQVEKKLDELSHGRAHFTAPLLNPCEGAILLAMKEFNPEDFQNYKCKRLSNRQCY